MDHENVIWLGDLNYRLVCGDEEARRHIKANRLEVLVHHDQLTREMAAGRVFKVGDDAHSNWQRPQHDCRESQVGIDWMLL